MTSKKNRIYRRWKTFIAIAGESHNSSSSDAAYMQGVWDKAEEEGLNTLLLPVTWELTEPVEGQFDFTLVDTLINQARERKNASDLPLVWYMEECPVYVCAGMGEKRYGAIPESPDGKGQE